MANANVLTTEPSESRLNLEQDFNSTVRVQANMANTSFGSSAEGGNYRPKFSCRVTEKG
jgi:hypothetical protein